MPNRIAELRKSKKWSQTALATRLGVTQKSVSNWEKETGHPSWTNLIAMSDLFSASMDYIMGRSSVRQLINPDSLDEDELSVVEIYRSLKAEDRMKLKAYLQGLSDRK